MILLNYSDLPEWYKDNEYIKTGYRPVLNSIYNCINSIFSIHNETFNIWSHMLPILYYFFLSIYSFFDNLSFFHRLLLSIYCIGTSATHLFSVLHHTLLCHSEKMHFRCITLDYYGITTTMYSSIILLIYMCFYNNFIILIIYISLITFLIMYLISQLSNLSFYHNDNRVKRSCLLIIISASFCAPLIHYGSISVDNEYFTKLIYCCSVTSLLYLISMIIYANRIPESCVKNKSYFDNIGSSHNIFHILATSASLSYYMGVRYMFYYLEY